uniref:Uncharacterized protein n=1 Tax=Lygus hesperus TaxID=30085 RepID=A0A146M3E9_LYGHE
MQDSIRYSHAYRTRGAMGWKKVCKRRKSTPPATQQVFKETSIGRCLNFRGRILFKLLSSTIPALRKKTRAQTPDKKKGNARPPGCVDPRWLSRRSPIQLSEPVEGTKIGVGEI